MVPTRVKKNKAKLPILDEEAIEDNGSGEEEDEASDDESDQGKSKRIRCVLRFGCASMIFACSK